MYRGAYPIYLIMSACTSLFGAMIFTVNLVYQTRTIGLNPLQLVLVGTTLEAVYFLAQVPTGVLADAYSRRWSVVVGMVLTGAGFMLEGAVPRFWAVLLAQVVWGTGAAFTDGADAAWLADELGEADSGRAYLRGAQIGSAAGLVGIAAGVALASVRLNLPVFIGGLLYVLLGLFLLLRMPEHHFTPTPREQRTTWQHLGHTLGAGLRVVRARPVLWTILGIGACFGMFTEGFDRLWQYHFLHYLTFPPIGHLQPVVWFGLIAAGLMPLNIGAAELVRRRVDTSGHHSVARALFAMDALMIASVVTLGLAGNFALALCAYWTASLMRGTRLPLTVAWTNQNIDAGVRATVLSLGNQVDAIGQVVGGPVIGVIATAFSTRVSLVASAALLTPALFLYARTLRHRLPELEALPVPEIAHE
jgi:DHA3 family tetracycline resistance protein-like MFS transporter